MGWCVVAVVGAIVLGGCRLNFDAVLLDAPGNSSTADSDAHAVADCPAFARFCEDFETGDLSRWTRPALEGPATAVVSTTRARSGVFALETRVEPDAMDGGNAAAALRLAPQDMGRLAVRQWINLGSVLRDFNIVIEIRNTTTNEYVAAGGNNNANWVSTEDPGGGAVDHQTNVATPGLDTWTCVELVYVFTPPSMPRIELYVNDALILDEASAYFMPRFDEVRVGIARADMTGFSLFTDDVVIADERIGCE